MFFQNKLPAILKSRQHLADEPTEVKFFGDFKNIHISEPDVIKNKRSEGKKETYGYIKAAYDGDCYASEEIQNIKSLGVSVIHSYDHPKIKKCNRHERHNIKDINKSFMTQLHYDMGYDKIRNSLNINDTSITNKYGYAIESTMNKTYERICKYDSDEIYRAVSESEMTPIDLVTSRIMKIIGAVTIDNAEEPSKCIRPYDMITWDTLIDYESNVENQEKCWDSIKSYINSYKQDSTDEVYINKNGIWFYPIGSVTEYNVLDTSCVYDDYRVSDLRHDISKAALFDSEIFWCEHIIDMQQGYEKRINLGKILNESRRTHIVLNARDNNVLTRFKNYSSGHSYVHMKFSDWNTSLESLHTSYLSNLITYEFEGKLYLLPRRGEIKMYVFSSVEWLDKIKPRANTMSRVMMAAANRVMKHSDGKTKSRTLLRNIYWLTNEIDSEYNIDLKDEMIPLNHMYVPRDYSEEANTYCWVPRKRVERVDTITMRCIHTGIKCQIKGQKVCLPIKGIMKADDIEFENKEDEIKCRQASHFVLTGAKITNNNKRAVIGLLTNGHSWHYINPAIVRIKQYTKIEETIEVGSLMMNYEIKG